tara:strand:- start:948 stop:1538 length:591 start_codon:yes stop_codon:yes gene_type:complete
MPWAAAAAVVGAGVSAYSSNKASKQQAASEKDSMAAQERMFERGLEETKPFRDAGIGQLEGYQNLLTGEGRAEFLGDYYKSPEYLAQQQQATDATLRAQSAQGGLRGGSTYSALENIAPQLGQNALASQMQNQMSLINIGQGLSGQASNQANVLGQGLGQGYQNIGAYQAGNTMNQGSQVSNMLGSLAGIYTGGGF